MKRAAQIIGGDRDFVVTFPNQEPRDFMEVTSVALNKKNAGVLDLKGAMEETGEDSPDEMIERVQKLLNLEPPKRKKKP